jgi:hypothetical protein
MSTVITIAQVESNALTSKQYTCQESQEDKEEQDSHEAENEG